MKSGRSSPGATFLFQGHLNFDAMNRFLVHPSALILILGGLLSNHSVHAQSVGTFPYNPDANEQRIGGVKRLARVFDVPRRCVPALRCASSARRGHRCVHGGQRQSGAWFEHLHRHHPGRTDGSHRPNHGFTQHHPEAGTRIWHRRQRNLRASAQGRNTTASGLYSFACNQNSTATATCSSAIGEGSTATAVAAHSQGFGTNAEGLRLHAQGYYSDATSNYAHRKDTGRMPRTQLLTLRGMKAKPLDCTAMQKTETPSPQALPPMQRAKPPLPARTRPTAKVMKRWRVALPRTQKGTPPQRRDCTATPRPSVHSAPGTSAAAIGYNVMADQENSTGCGTMEPRGPSRRALRRGKRGRCRQPKRCPSSGQPWAT